jgi:Kef-type K+ transport system membrane component KefB
MTKRQCRMGRLIWAMVVISAIALVFMLSIAITLNPGHGFGQVVFALPIFFVLLFLAVLLGDWLQVEMFYLQPKPQLSAYLTRGPPA